MSAGTHQAVGGYGVLWMISRHAWSASGQHLVSIWPHGLVSHGAKSRTSTDGHGAKWWVGCQYVYRGACLFLADLPQMPYVSVATHLRVGDSLRAPVLIPLDALARRSQLNPDDPLTRKLSSFLRPQSKHDIQKFQCRLIAHTPPRKPLKSSLKCSRGRRVISEPSAPPTHSPRGSSPPPSPKSVRFKDKDGDLESVCLFRPTGRPSSISHPRSHSDTETETDTDSALAAQQQQRDVSVRAAIFATTEISPIPSPHTSPESNVHLESLTLLPARPPLLRGTVRVRNIAFEKCVAARFTTDDWTTISESHARYVGPAPAAPGAWDLFAFTIPLQAPRTLLLALRYAVPGTGEWWDNNGGADFRVVLAPATSSPPRPPPVIGATPGFGMGGVGATARPRRALVGAYRANGAPAKTYPFPTLTQRSLPVPPARSQWPSVL